MQKPKKDYIHQHELDNLIITEYRRGRTVKSIAKDFKHYTIDHEGNPLPKGYVEQVVYNHVMEAGI